MSFRPLAFIFSCYCRVFEHLMSLDYQSYFTEASEGISSSILGFHLQVYRWPKYNREKNMVTAGVVYSLLNTSLLMFLKILCWPGWFFQLLLYPVSWPFVSQFISCENLFSPWSWAIELNFLQEEKTIRVAIHLTLVIQVICISYYYNKIPEVGYFIKKIGLFRLIGYKGSSSMMQTHSTEGLLYGCNTSRWEHVFLYTHMMSFPLLTKHQDSIMEYHPKDLV